MKRVSVVIPFCNEHPQVAFTLQSILLELRGFCTFDVILANNYTEEVEKQGFPEDSGHSYFDSLISDGRVTEVKLIRYDDKLSHWNAKNAALEVAEGELIFFCDAHIMLTPGSLRNMIQCYSDNEINGSLHLPITYLNDRPGTELIYLCVHNLDQGMLHYRFTPYSNVSEYNRNNGIPYPVPCMSTCGMLISRKIIIDRLHGWPTLLGIYGGGENYLNYVQAVLGLTPHIMPGGSIYHYAAPRGYRWNHYDWMRNRFIAAYLAGGVDFLVKAAEGAGNTKKLGSHRQLYQLVDEILSNSDLQTRADHIEENRCYSLQEWIKLKKASQPHLMLETGEWK